MPEERNQKIGKKRQEETKRIVASRFNAPIPRRSNRYSYPRLHRQNSLSFRSFSFAISGRERVSFPFLWLLQLSVKELVRPRWNGIASRSRLLYSKRRCEIHDETLQQ